MGMVEELARLAAENRKEFEEYRKEVKSAFTQVRDDHDKATRANKEAVEEQEKELYEKSEQAKHDQYEAASERKIGVHAVEEDETDKPVKRVAREDDATTRNIGANHDQEEETEPYQRPGRWHDQDDETDTLERTPRDDWGSSTRRIGHDDEDDD